MEIKNKLLLLSVAVSLIPMTSFAQNVAPLPSDSDTRPVESLTINGTPAAPQPTQQQVPARMNLAIPKSLQQQQVQSPAPVVQADPATQVPLQPQPVDISPKMVSPMKILNPDQVRSQNLFKKEFGDITGNNATMEKLLADAYEKNPSINAAREGLKTVDEQVFQAYSGFLPKVDYTYTRNRSETTPLGGKEGTFYTSNNSFNVTQGLFGGGESYYAVKSAEKRVIAAQQELKATEQKFLLDSINAYITYIFAQKVLKLAQNNQHVLEEQLKASKDRFVVGDATKTDVAQSEARLANAHSSNVISEGDFVRAQADFKRIFGVEAPESLPMPTNLPDIPASLDETLQLAMQNNPELNQLKYLVESRNEDIDVQQSQLYPQVDVRGSVGESQTPTSAGIFSDDTKTVALAVTVPIYNGGVTFSRTRTARDVRNQTKQQYNDTLNSVRSSVIQSWQQITTTQSNIEATKSSLTASEFALQGVTEEQKEGARTILDVLDAEQERFGAEINHARAIKDSVLAIYNLKSVVGELTPSKLGLPINDYDPKVHYNNTRFKLIGL